jgi:hypothetical protein
MNERIQELWKRAGGHYDSGNQHTWPQYTIDDPAKFAELIVKECVKLCEHESNDDEYDQYDMGQSVKAENIKTAIKQHFGVEE